MIIRDLYKLVQDLDLKIDSIFLNENNEVQLKIKDSLGNVIIDVSSPGEDWRQKLTGAEDLADTALMVWIKNQIAS